MSAHKKILITGGTGMVGSAFRYVKTAHELIFVNSTEYDLTSQYKTSKMFVDHEPDTVIHLAARVGGVKGNSDYVADFFHENIMINTNLLAMANDHNVSKVVSLLSTCIYPDDVTYPLTEDQIHCGAPHQSNFGYAYAKRMLDVQSRALRQQYGRNFICAVPNNLYGPHDNFDLENGHVIPAIIRKIHEAKLTGKTPTMWGSGRPLREFTFSYDIAKILLFLVENYEDPLPINIGKTTEISILDLVETICSIMEYRGPIMWSKANPEGQFRKPSANDRFMEIYPSFRYTSLDHGLRKTCNWFIENYPNVRGVN